VLLLIKTTSGFFFVCHCFSFILFLIYFRMYPEVSRSKVRLFNPGTPLFKQSSTRRECDPGSPSPPDASPWVVLCHIYICYLCCCSSKKKKKIISSDDTPLKNKGKSKEIQEDVYSEDWDEDQISDVQQLYVVFFIFILFLISAFFTLSKMFLLILMRLLYS